MYLQILYMVHISILSSEWKKNMSSDFDDGFTFLPSPTSSLLKKFTIQRTATNKNIYDAASYHISYAQSVINIGSLFKIELLP